jgi:FkbM family methyltransferase
MADKEESKIMNSVKRITLGVLKNRDLEIVTKSRLEELETYEKRLELLRELVGIKIDQSVLLEIIKISVICSSQSQLMQDIFASYFNESNPGKYEKYFVEFGSTDGKTLSNTYILEKQFNWQGILAEPARMWHLQLLTTRKCQIDTRAVSEFSGGKVPFMENKVGELSRIVDRIESKNFKSKVGVEYIVETISLNDLLNSYKAPRNIGYLSVDTEGNEYEILKGFNFEEYKFGFINVEHNYSENRQKIHDLLVRNGYTRILEDFSKWDDFYIPRDHPLIKLF